MSLPPLFCPSCHAYTALKPDCRCGWSATPAERTAMSAPRTLADLDQPVYGEVCLAGGPAMCRLLVGCDKSAQRSGAVVAIDPVDGAELWRVPTGAGVVGGAACLGRQVVFGDAAGFVHAVDIDGTGHRRALAPLEGEIRARPTVVDEARAFVGTSAGVVACIDPRTCEIVRQVRLRPREGGGTVRIDASALWLDETALFGTIEEEGYGGRLVRFDPVRGQVDALLEFDAACYAAPILLDHPLVLVALSTAGRDPGRVIAVDVRTRRTVGVPFATTGRVRATPTLVGGILYLGDHAHHLHAVDARSLKSVWDAPFAWDHAITTTPLVMPEHDLLLFGDNHGAVAAVDLTRSAEHEVWAHRLPHSPVPGRPPAVLSGLLRFGQRVLYAASDGRVESLPYYLDRVDWAGDVARRRGDAEAEARLIVFDLGRKGERRAAQILGDADRHRDAARVYEAAGELTEAAEAFERDEAWDDAARLWDRLEPERVSRCREQAARAAGRPFLQMQPAACTPLKVGQTSTLTLQFANRFPCKARNIRVRLSGPIETSAEVERAELLCDRAPWVAKLAFVPVPRAAGDIELTIAAHYDDDAHRPAPEQRWSVPGRVAPADQPAVVWQVERYIAAERYVEVAGDAGTVRVADGDTSANGASADEAATPCDDSTASGRTSIDVKGRTGYLVVDRPGGATSIHTRGAGAVHVTQGSGDVEVTADDDAASVRVD